MKKLILFSILLLSVTQVMNAQVQSNTTISPELYNYYVDDVYALALGRIHEVNSPAASQAYIPSAYVDSIWDAIAAVYNAFVLPERDTVFDIECIHKRTFNYQEHPSVITIETQHPLYYYYWGNGQTLTGDPAIDTILLNYGFTLTSSYTVLGTWVSATFETNEYLNTIYISQLIESLPTIPFAIAGQVVFGDGYQDINYSRDADYRYVKFRLKWGDCLSGCIHNKTWHFRIDHSLIVECTGVTQTEPYNNYYPSPNCNITYDSLTFAWQNYEVCEGDSVFVNNSWYSSSVSFNDTLVSVSGFDSIIFYSVDVLPAEYPFTMDICEGEYVLFNGDSLSQTGFYIYNYVSASGCDSIVTLDLGVHPLFEQYFYSQLCGDESITYYGVTYDSAGVYVQNYQTPYGCDSLFHVIITQETIPEIQIDSLFPDSINQDDPPISLDFGIPSGGSYEIDGIQCDTLFPDYYDPGDLLIIYTLIDSVNGCPNKDSLSIYISESYQGISMKDELKFRVYPNPGNGLFYIELIHAQSTGTTCTIMDLHGRKVSEYMLLNTRQLIDLRALSKGVYLIQLQNNDQTGIRKIMVQ